jgi:hypothetical protein
MSVKPQPPERQQRAQRQPQLQHPANLILNNPPRTDAVAQPERRNEARRVVTRSQQQQQQHPHRVQARAPHAPAGACVANATATAAALHVDPAHTISPHALNGIDALHVTAVAKGYACGVNEYDYADPHPDDLDVTWLQSILNLNEDEAGRV